MLKKMRWRFILAAMIATFTVTGVLVAIINIGNYSSTARRQDATAIAILDFQRESGGNMLSSNEGPFRDQSPEKPYALRFFSVQCNPQGEVISVARDHIASISESDAAAYAQKVLQKGKGSGYYGEYRYVVQYDAAGIRLIFLNCAGDLEFMRSLLKTSSTVAAISFLSIFFLVVLLSKRAINPYVKNMELQKRFITDASHEIKTPLTAISASADVLSMEYADNEWVETIQKQSARLSRLVSSLVTLSRLDEEQPLAEKAEFSFSDAAWEISESFCAIAKAKGKTYVQDIEENLSFCGDRTAIQQMISILLDNAVRYSDEGGQIKLAAYRQHKNIVLEVSNTCDLPDTSVLPRLFDRFYRPDESRSVNTGGYGIGLSIAKATAEAHNGRIAVESEQGKTICFRVVL